MKYLSIIWVILFITTSAKAQSYSTGVPLPPINVTLTGAAVVSITGTVVTSSAPNPNGVMITTSVTSAESNFAAPAFAVGVLLEGDSGNFTNIRWGFSNSSASILSSVKGVLIEPGRDTGYIPIGSGSFLHLIAATSLTATAEIQWVLSQ